ncbi:MAG: hypothetical protein JEY94_14915 [Melioribacteraceae bacterium]|nr:hypothetical protein [Melioribacteraceae bacterium]
MYKKLIATLSILLLLFVGCSDDKSSPNEPEDTSAAGKNKISLTGSDTDSFECDVLYLNDGASLGITMADKTGNKALILNSNEMTTGTFSIPNDYEALYTDSENAIMYSFHAGTVKIDEITQTKISGSITASAHPMSLLTFQVDESKTLTIDTSFEF